ncbi:hypothetical protein ACGF0J_25745 [Nonomuraea sp. NPDC047897]|uniref:hypothetical protein n=1 Tax=Nonomuraea sp. NPDC047897 TaxID=3364346 RepID=UPI00372098A2
MVRLLMAAALAPTPVLPDDRALDDDAPARIRVTGSPRIVTVRVSRPAPRTVTPRTPTTTLTARRQAPGPQGGPGVQAVPAGTWRAASRLRTAASGVRTVVVALRRRADAVADAELGRLASRAPALDEAARDEVRLAVQRVVDEFLASPIMRLTSNAGSPRGESYADAVRALFALDGQAAPSGGRRARPQHRNGRTA